MKQFQQDRVKMTNDIIQDLYSSDNAEVVKIGFMFLHNKIYDLSTCGWSRGVHTTEEGQVLIHPSSITDFLHIFWDRRKDKTYSISESARLEIKSIYKKWNKKTNNI